VASRIIKSLFGMFGRHAGEGEYQPAYGRDLLLHPLDGTGWHRALTTATRNGVAANLSATAKYVNALVSMPQYHYTVLENGSVEHVKSSAFLRFLRRPTRWQTIAEWLAEGEWMLMETGNAVGYITRNDRTEITHITWASHWAHHIDPASGALFYSLALPAHHGQWKQETLVPARDVLHLRINVDGKRDPIMGRSPLQWCASAMATNQTLSAFLLSYLNNRASPSYVLSTDMQLSPTQMDQLREAWNKQSASIASGGTPILGGGLKPHAMGVAPGDTLLIDTFNLSVEDIARAFNLPKSLLGIDETASNAENTIREWMALGLGAHVEMWEQALERAFEFGTNEFIEFDTETLLRLEPQAEATRLKELVVGGIMSIDQARSALRLPHVDGGHGAMPTQQQQQIPIDLLHELHVAEIDAKTRAAVVSQQAPPTPTPTPEGPDPEVSKALVFSLLQRKRLEHERD
jgi:HK97 family phage portal protein